MLRDLLSEIVAAIENEQPFALAQIIKSSGSTPQRAGACALFFRDGRILGTIGSGCLEAEARRRALDALDARTPLLFELHLDNDFGWDEGLICGGIATIFIDPMPYRHLVIFQQTLEAVREDQGVWLWTTVRDETTPAEMGRAGERRLGFPAPGQETRETPMLHTGKTRGDHVPLEYFVHPLPPRPHLLIAGAGYIGAALARLAHRLGFRVTVLDDRPDLCNATVLPHAQCIVGDIAGNLATQIQDGDYVAIVTRGHRHDSAAMRVALGRDLSYLGMIGSRRKRIVIWNQLKEEGAASDDDLSRVQCPMGLDIGAIGVEEIALSIAAQLVAVRRGKVDKNAVTSPTVMA